MLIQISKPVFLAILLAVSLTTNIEAAAPAKLSSQITVHWNDLGTMILGHKIAVVLPTGVIVEGKVLALGSDALDLQVSKTSKNSVQPKGRVTIPRSALHMLQLKKSSKKWRIILTSASAGFAVLVGIASAAANNETGDGIPLPFPVIVAGGGAGGYLLGSALDGHRDIAINIVP